MLLTKPDAPHVFIYGYYGCGNLGDELLLSATASGVLQRWPDARFRVRNLGPVFATPDIADRIHATNIEAILQDRSRGRGARAFAYLRAANRALRGCHAMVLGGGTLLHAKTSLGSLLLLSCLVLLARFHRMPVIGVGLGAAHLDRRSARILLCLIEWLASDLAMRDAESLSRMPVSSKTRVTADLVYGWWPREVRRAHGPATIAVTLWSAPPANAPGTLEALAQALAVAARTGSRIKCLLFQCGDTASGGLTDEPALDHLAALLARHGVMATIERPASTPAALQQAFAGVTVHVGARFHAHVVASLLGIPFVGIATDPKISSLCATFGMPCFDIDAMAETPLQRAIDQARLLSIDDAKTEALRRASNENLSWFDRHRGPEAHMNGGV